MTIRCHQNEMLKSEPQCWLDDDRPVQDNEAILAYDTDRDWDVKLTSLRPDGI